MLDSGSGHHRTEESGDSCAGFAEGTSTMRLPDHATIHQDILEKYRNAARSPQHLFRYPTGESSALGLGYPPELVAEVPAQVRLRFVGVGNPFGLGPILPGQTIVDLGCGAGFDVFIAAQLVGSEGRVAGVDLSPEMLRIAELGRAATGFKQIDFHVAAIEALPFPDASFDVALSNGVLNLIPDKPAVLREILRVLRPGGHLQACDIGLTGEEPPPDKAPWSD
jgi:SAM-dependent methyltransferase